MGEYISHAVKRKKCNKCKTNTNTYTINHIPYQTIYGKKKVKKLPGWENWCMVCIKAKAKELGW